MYLENVMKNKDLFYEINIFVNIVSWINLDYSQYLAFSL